MTITKRKLTRQITEKEALRLKEVKPFKTLRQDAKACFPGDTSVLIKNEGWVELSKLVPEINQGLFTPEVRNLEIMTPTGYQSIQYTFFSGTKDWIDFTLSNGDVIKVTPNHRCIIVRDAIKIVVEAGEVVDTDFFINSNEIRFSIKSIKRYQVENDPIYCVTVNDPHEIIVKPKNSINAYQIMNCNFGAIFGISYPRFSAGALETVWSLERINTFIKDKGLEDVIEVMAEKHPKVEPKLWKYYAVSDFILKQFFSTYKGLMDRIKRNEELAKKIGYIRSYHGGIRRLPMLMLSTNDEGKTRWDDDRKEISGLINIASNTSVQTDEVATITQCTTSWEENPLSEYGLIIGTVHDSIDLYVEKTHAVEVCLALKDTFEKNDLWQEGIKFPIDLTIVDITKGQYYKKGIDLDEFLKQEQQ